MAKKPNVWSPKSISRLRAAVKEQLDQREREDGLDGRLKAIMTAIADLTAESNPDDGPKLFVYLMSALGVQARAPLLEKTEVRRIQKLATDLLRVNQLDSKGKSRFLWGDFLEMTSMIHRKDGLHWLSAAEHLLALSCHQDEPLGGKAEHILGQGIRALRLGLGEYAVGLLDKAMAEETAGNNITKRALLEKTRYFRICGELDEASTCSKELLAMEVEAPIFAELKWEALLRDFLKSQDISPILSALVPDSDLYHGAYVLEAKLMTFASGNDAWIRKVPKIETLRKKKELQILNLGFIAELLKELEQTYLNDELHFANSLCSVLSHAGYLMTYDKEMLGYLACAQVFKVRGHQDLAELTFAEYHQRCFTLSQGRTQDAFGLTPNSIFQNTKKRLVS